MTKKPLYLLPQHGIKLEVAECSDPERFVRVFRETWAKIPGCDRRLMLDHWRKTRIEVGECIRPDRFLPPVPTETRVLIPWIMVQQDVPPGLNLDGSNWAGYSLGHLFIGYYGLVFRTAVVDAIPDDLLAVLISHELAHHAYELYHPGSMKDEDKDWQELQVQTFNLDEWWFDEDALTAWLAAHPELCEHRVQSI